MTQCQNSLLSFDVDGKPVSLVLDRSGRIMIADNGVSFGMHLGL